MRGCYKKSEVLILTIFGIFFLLLVSGRAQVVSTYGIYGGRILETYSKYKRFFSSSWYVSK